MEAATRLLEHYALADLPELKETLGDHLLRLGSEIGFFETGRPGPGAGRLRRRLGPEHRQGHRQRRGTRAGRADPLGGTRFPDPLDPRFFAGHSREDRPVSRTGFRVFQIGFSLYERAWTLRGMENADDGLHRSSRFRPTSLFERSPIITSPRSEKPLKYDIDAVYFGDDWGQQHGLQMGPRLWREFIYPRTEADVRRRAEGGKVRDDPLLRRRAMNCSTT